MFGLGAGGCRFIGSEKFFLWCASHIAICEGRKWLRVVAKKHKFV